MVSLKKKSGLSESDLVSFVLNKTKGKDIIIIGGHYMLLFNKFSNRLEPAIGNNINTSFISNVAKTLVGNYPLSSFMIALEIKALKEPGDGLANIALLVNDHFFQSNMMSELFDYGDLNWGDYKERYYRYSAIPECFQKLLDKYNLKPDDVFVKNHYPNSKYFHPYLFSETSLRKRFDKRLKTDLAKLDNFSLSAETNQKSKLFFKSQNDNSFCLTESGECGCSGEVVQFIVELDEIPNSVLVFLVPQDCYDSVCIGVEASIEYLNNRSTKNKNSSTYIVATGFGDDHFIGVDIPSTIKLTYFNS